MILIRDTIGGYFGGYVALWRSHSVRNALMSAPLFAPDGAKDP